MPGVEEESKIEAPSSPGMVVDEGSSSSQGPEQEEPSLPKVSDFEDPEELSPEALQNIAAGRDCLIDDPELLGSKKGLTSK